MEEKLQIVRNHKDTVFRMLYRSKSNLLELYNALNGTDYEDPGGMEVYTLENAIYLSMKNDVSFLLGSELNLYEHQASFNPNMPLRDLLYIARQLEKYIRDKTLYSSTLTKIPVPRFVVFYNGTQKEPERQVLKLSDAYQNPVEQPELELKVLMININPGHNCAIMEKCRTLREYCEFVACIRKHVTEENIAEAVEDAVTECISRNILAEFLSSQRAEVVAMSIFEYNQEEEMKKVGSANYKAGLTEGKAEGIVEGEAIGLAKAIIGFLSDLGDVPANLRSRIEQETDLVLLQRWLKLAARTVSLDCFIEDMYSLI